MNQHSEPTQRINTCESTQPNQHRESTNESTINTGESTRQSTQVNQNSESTQRINAAQSTPRVNKQTNNQPANQQANQHANQHANQQANQHMRINTFEST